jgi:ubiquinone biosynthesis protein COQ9
MDALTKQALEMFPKLTYEERLIVHALIKAKLCEKESPAAQPEKVSETVQS